MLSQYWDAMLGKANVCQSDSLVTVTVSMCCHNNATHCWSRLMHITMNASESTTRYSAFFKSLTVALVIRKTPTLYGAESSCVLTKPCYYTKFSNQFIPLYYLHTLSKDSLYYCPLIYVYISHVPPLLGVSRLMLYIYSHFLLYDVFCSSHYLHFIEPLHLKCPHISCGSTIL